MSPVFAPEGAAVCNICAKVVRFPSMQLLRLLMVVAPPKVPKAAPNKNKVVPPLCVPTPPSLFPVVAGPPLTGVMTEPTKNLPAPFRAVDCVVVALKETEPPANVESS